MATYEEIKKQIAELEVKARELRTLEIAEAKEKIKAICETFELTLDDLPFLASSKPTKKAYAPRKSFEKIELPEGTYQSQDKKNTYEVRRNKKGKKPNWLSKLSLEEATSLRIN